MARLKDINWNCGVENGNNTVTPHSLNHEIVAVLMDLRDELKEIKRAVQPLRHLDCHNFLAIPHTLAAIKRNTHKKKRIKK